MSAPEIWDYQDAESLCRAAASMVRTLLVFRVGRRGRASLALSGDCPARMYSLLAGEQYQAAIPWELVDLFWTSAVAVHEDGESGYDLAGRLLVPRVPIRAAAVHPIRLELGASEAARIYGEKLAAFAAPSSMPELDVVCLSMNGDGYLAEVAPHPGDGVLASALKHGPDGREAVAVSSRVLERAFAVILLAVGTRAGQGLATLLGRGGLVSESGNGFELRPSNRFVLFLDREARQALGS